MDHYEREGDEEYDYDQEGDEEYGYDQEDEEEEDGFECEILNPRPVIDVLKGECYYCEREFKKNETKYQCYWKCEDIIKDEYAFSYDMIINHYACKKCWNDKFIIWNKDKPDEKVCSECKKRTCTKCGNLIVSQNYDKYFCELEKIEDKHGMNVTSVICKLCK